MHRRGRHLARRKLVRPSTLVGAAVIMLSGAVLVSQVEDVSRGDAAPPDRQEPAVATTPRAFSADSWWNTPLPVHAPLDPAGADILDYLRTAPGSGPGCLMLAGTGRSRWGLPIYEAGPGDPEYHVTGVIGGHLRELSSLRIPRGARPAGNNDGSMVVYDRSRGYVVALTNAEYHDGRDRWTATGASITYLDSNGLHEATGLADDSRNRGTHRGNNGATMAVSWSEVEHGAIRHVLKAASGPEVADRFVFPMVGSDGDFHGDDPRVPPQGLRLRIKPSIDLDELDLGPEARVIAQALQDYGFYIGDSGGRTALKLESTRAEGLGQRWQLSADALCGLPFTTSYWDVVAEGYDPAR